MLQGRLPGRLLGSLKVFTCPSADAERLWRQVSYEEITGSRASGAEVGLSWLLGSSE
jgi:hypothetical protein